MSLSTSASKTAALVLKCVGYVNDTFAFTVLQETDVLMGRIVLIWTHVKPMSADTAVDVQSKMHLLFIEVVSRHTKIIS